MATYLELQSVSHEGPMLDKIEVAVWVKAVAIVAEATPTAARLAWAIDAMKSSRPQSEWLYRYMLAANAAMALSSILGATDAAISTKVSAAIDKFYP